jgi:two-component system phosphate regulon sensor histidine kinase PhoR
MTWLSIFLFAALAGAGVWFWKFSRHWRHLERIVSDLAAGRRPSSFVFLGSPRFGKLARKLESLADEQMGIRKRIEEEKFNFEAILASMAEGVLVVDNEHRIRLVNDSFRRLFQIKSDPGGQSVLSAVRESSIEELIRATLAGGGPQAREISPAHLPQSHFAASAVLLRDEHGAVNGVVGVFHDISRLRQLEEVRREFVANVSHELRTPLSIFHGYLENLQDNLEMPRADLQGILAIMRKHSLRLNALLEDLLTIARLESRREKLEPVEIQPGPFIREIVNDWRLKLAERKITAEVEAAPGLPPLLADAFRMEQVLNNLLENAIKFTPEGGRVHIGMAREGSQMVIRVADTGVGIPPADLPHVFEQFYRVEKARSREAGGTGLGLSIVKHIIALHGGSVEAESILGRGATIILRLPLAR